MSPFSIFNPTLVHFGNGVRSELTAELVSRGDRVLFVHGKSDAVYAPVTELIEASAQIVAEITVSSEPTTPDVNKQFLALPSTRFTTIVACGGGSVIDFAKALKFCLLTSNTISDDDLNKKSVENDQGYNVPLVVLPTTAGTGSEVTSNAVLATRQNPVKVSLRDKRIFPDTALVDPDLMLAAPRSVYSIQDWMP